MHPSQFAVQYAVQDAQRRAVQLLIGQALCTAGHQHAGDRRAQGFTGGSAKSTQGQGSCIALLFSVSFPPQPTLKPVVMILGRTEGTPASFSTRAFSSSGRSKSSFSYAPLKGMMGSPPWAATHSAILGRNLFCKRTSW